MGYFEDAIQCENQGAYVKAVEYYEQVLNSFGLVQEKEKSRAALLRIREGWHHPWQGYIRIPAEQLNSIACMYYEGKLVYGGSFWGGYDKAKQWWESAVNQGDAIAYRNIGWLHENGHGAELDYVKASKYYRQAIERGYAAAQDDLQRLFQKIDAKSASAIGNMYLNGEGVMCDYVRAKAWLEKAKEMGCAVACRNLGWLYENGYGVERDYLKAMQYYQQSIEKGNYDLSVPQQDLKRLFDHVDGNIANAIGLIYYMGHGVKQNLGQAKQWFGKASQQYFAFKTYSSIIEAVKVGDIAYVLNMLEGSTININFQDSEGCTPLHWAVRTSNFCMLLILLEKGSWGAINPFIKNMRGKTALEEAQEQGSNHMIHSISEHMAGKIVSFFSWATALFNPATFVTKIAYATVMPVASWLAENTGIQAIETITQVGITATAFAASPPGFLINTAASYAVEAGIKAAQCEDPFLKAGARLIGQNAFQIGKAVNERMQSIPRKPFPGALQPKRPAVDNVLSDSTSKADNANRQADTITLVNSNASHTEVHSSKITPAPAKEVIIESTSKVTQAKQDVANKKALPARSVAFFVKAAPVIAERIASKTKSLAKEPSASESASDFTSSSNDACKARVGVSGYSSSKLVTISLNDKSSITPASTPSESVLVSNQNSASSEYLDYAHSILSVVEEIADQLNCSSETKIRIKAQLKTFEFMSEFNTAKTAGMTDSQAFGQAIYNVGIDALKEGVSDYGLSLIPGNAALDKALDTVALPGHILELTPIPELCDARQQQLREKTWHDLDLPTDTDFGERMFEQQLMAVPRAAVNVSHGCDYVKEQKDTLLKSGISYVGETVVRSSHPDLDFDESDAGAGNLFVSDILIPTATAVDEFVLQPLGRETFTSAAEIYGYESSQATASEAPFLPSLELVNTPVADSTIKVPEYRNLSSEPEAKPVSFWGKFCSIFSSHSSPYGADLQGSSDTGVRGSVGIRF